MCSASCKSGNVAVVALRPSSAGKTWVQEEEKTWEVFPAVTGRQFREGDADDLRAVAVSVGGISSGRSKFPRPAQVREAGDAG